MEDELKLKKFEENEENEGSAKLHSMLQSLQENEDEDED